MVSIPQNVGSNQAFKKVTQCFRDVLSFGYMLPAVFGGEAAGLHGAVLIDASTGFVIAIRRMPPASRPPRAAGDTESRHD
jgi:hypothetical protein